jgi:hypothetical protein
MIQLKLVKTVHAEQEDNVDGLNHGTKVLLQLVKAWYNSNIVIVADSYFALVECAEDLLRRNLKFISVIKTSHRRFPNHHLQRVDLQQHGDRFGLVAHHEDGTPKFLSLVWMDRGRRYSVTSCSSPVEGRPYVCNGGDNW